MTPSGCLTPSSTHGLSIRQPARERAFELIVLDDASNDNYLAVIRDYLAPGIPTVWW
jgi:glycosyltransferase involved in cell wall biosynthesis